MSKIETYCNGCDSMFDDTIFYDENGNTLCENCYDSIHEEEEAKWLNA